MSEIEIDGKLFDAPTKDDLTKWNYREWKEGKSKYREYWIENYEDINGAKCRECYCLQLKNGSSASLDGKRLRDKDFENAKKIFDMIDEVNR